MRLFNVVTVLALAPVFSQAQESGTYRLWYDILYDEGQNSFTDVICSNGEHGMLTQGYTTFDSINIFPFIGGSPWITSWDSPFCGTCWNLTYANPQGFSGSLIFVATNTGNNEGFTISSAAFDILTSTDGSPGSYIDGVEITATQIENAVCDVLI